MGSSARACDDEWDTSETASTELPPLRKLSKVAERAAEEAENKRLPHAPLRRAFTRTAADPAEASALFASGALDHDSYTPMMRLMRTGEVRLKTYLTLVWLCAKYPHDTRPPAGKLAQAMGVDGNGARRVNDALRYLEERRFIVREQRPGQSTRVWLRHESGDGSDYVRPYELAKSTDADVKAANLFAQVPRQLWTRGWIAVLSGRALACLLILLDASSGREDNDTKSVKLDEGTEYREVTSYAPRYFPQAHRRQLYTISPDTWRRGMVELERYGLITRGWRRQMMFYTDHAKQYRTYQVNLEGFERLAGPPVDE